MTEGFESRNKKFIKLMGKDKSLKKLTNSWFYKSSQYEYSYHFKWLGRPIIQFPQDILALQEIIWKIKPDLIIETGIARGGSLIFLASILELLGRGKVVGIDIHIRPHNRRAIEKHPMYKRITMLEGSSTETNVVEKIFKLAKGKKTMVILDSNHTHDHVIQELKLYSPLVGRGSYLIVFDTIIQEMNNDFSKNRPWDKNNNPKTAVKEFLTNNNRFILDKEIEDKLLITVAPGGFLKCIKN